MTILMVTHEVTSILRVADKVLFVDNGVIAFEGTLTDARQSEIESLKDFFTVGTGGKKVTH
jgi:phospholipid/cholesterol/gamma-HCH transport system ATP-binding protein